MLLDVRVHANLFPDSPAHSHDVSVSKGAVTFLPRAKPDMPHLWERVYGLGACCSLDASAAMHSYIAAEADNAVPPPSPPPPSSKPLPAALQLVRCIYRDPAQVLQSFDLAPCKVLARYCSDVSGGQSLRVEALPSWIAALRRKAFWVDTAVWGTASPSRVLKYIAKGFSAALPGVRRAAILNPPTGDIRKGDGSIRALFEAEVALRAGFYRHQQVWPPPDRLAPPTHQRLPPVEPAGADIPEHAGDATTSVLHNRSDNHTAHRDGSTVQSSGAEQWEEASDGEGDTCVVRDAGRGVDEPLTPSEARTITDVLSGAVRLYQLKGGYPVDNVIVADGYGGYAFHGSGGSECGGCNDPDTCVCATLSLKKCSHKLLTPCHLLAGLSMTRIVRGWSCPALREHLLGLTLCPPLSV